ncbi:MAG: MlaD family protein [Mycobacteriaceae bacterium]
MSKYTDASGRGPKSSSLAFRGVATVVAIFLLLLALTIKQNRSNQEASLIVLADNVSDGLKPGSEVKYRGLTVGSVQKVTGNRNGYKNVEITIDKNNKEILAGPIQIGLITSTIFGASALELSASEVNPQVIKNGQVYVGKSLQRIEESPGRSQVPAVDSNAINEILAVTSRNSSSIPRTVKALLKMAEIIDKNNATDLSKNLATLADVGEGMNAYTAPSYKANDNFLNLIAVQPEYIPGKPLSLKELLAGIDLAKLDGSLDILGDLLLPALKSAQDIAFSYENSIKLLNRIEGALPSSEGQNHLRIQFIINEFPQFIPKSLDNSGVASGK